MVFFSQIDGIFSQIDGIFSQVDGIFSQDDGFPNEFENFDPKLISFLSFLLLLGHTSDAKTFFLLSICKKYKLSNPTNI